MPDFVRHGWGLNAVSMPQRANHHEYVLLQQPLMHRLIWNVSPLSLNQIHYPISSFDWLCVSILWVISTTASWGIYSSRTGGWLTCVGYCCRVQGMLQQQVCGHSVRNSSHSWLKRRRCALRSDLAVQINIDSYDSLLSALKGELCNFGHFFAVFLVCARIELPLQLRRRYFTTLS